MKALDKNNGLADFVHVVFGSKDVGAAIAKDQREMTEFSHSLDDMGFKRATDVSDLMEHPKSYFVLGETMDKDVYDFVVQYSTGQVEIFDGTAMRSRVLSPNYRNSATILLVKKEDLGILRNKGFDVLALAGPAYQT